VVGHSRQGKAFASQVINQFFIGQTPIAIRGMHMQVNRRVGGKGCIIYQT
jgi:hypothetical protein